MRYFCGILFYTKKVGRFTSTDFGTWRGIMRRMDRRRLPPFERQRPRLLASSRFSAWFSPVYVSLRQCVHSTKSATNV